MKNHFGFYGEMNTVRYGFKSNEYYEWEFLIGLVITEGTIFAKASLTRVKSFKVTIYLKGDKESKRIFKCHERLMLGIASDLPNPITLF